MGSGWVGYHAEQIGALHRRVRVAADDLLRLRSDDPAAAEAMQVVALARLHLEDDWLPLLEAHPGQQGDVGADRRGGAARDVTDVANGARR